MVHISIFRNYGESAGATQHHPHTQIIAIPVMPRNYLMYLDRNLDYDRRHGRGKLEDFVENERLSQVRMVAEYGDFSAFCPFASSFPFEVMIAPRRALTTLDELNRDDIANLAKLMKEVFARLDAQLGKFDYKLTFHLAPLNENSENEPFVKNA